MNSVQFRRDKKTILKILFIILACSILITFFIPSIFELTCYFSAYILIGLLIFVVSPRWLTSMTLFFVLYTINIGCGYFFIRNEGYSFNYQSFPVVVFSLALMLCGYAFRMKLCGLKHTHMKQRRIRINVSWTQALYTSYFFATTACILYFLKNKRILFSNLNDGRIEAASGNGMLLYIFRLHLMIIPLMYEEYKKKKINPVIFWILFIFACIQLLTTGFRTPLVTMILIIMIVNIYKGRINFRKAIPVVVILIILAIIFGAYRSGTSFNGIYRIARSQLFVGAQNLNYVFNAFPENISFQHGYTYFINLLMLRPGPDLDYTLWLKQVLGIEFSGGGITPTILGEFYMNFGYWGIYIGMFLFGIFVAKIDRWISKGEISFWKAYLMFQIASSCSGGIANVYLTPFILSLYYWVILHLAEPKERLAAS